MRGDGSDVRGGPQRKPPWSEERARVLVLGEAVEAFRAIARDLDAPTVQRLERELGARGAERTSPVELVLRVLEQPAALGSAGGDPLVRARLRGVRARQDLLQAEGGAVSGAELAAALGVSRQTVDAWRKAGRVLALERGRRGFAYPAWQVHDGRLLPGLDAALRELGARDAWSKLRFLLGPDPRLGGDSPLAALRRGEMERVSAVAAAHGEHGAL